MRIIPIAIAFLMLASCGQKPAAPPQEVLDFVKRRTDCNHWAGEEGYDAARRAEINTAYAKLRCATLQTDEAALKARYSGNEVVQKALARAND
ncbi:MAG TPA: hypothetical protein VJ798_06775 [Rhizomicrobium sp.]|nr:hypothetical protein [Rhizomicrobium sp.]